MVKTILKMSIYRCNGYISLGAKRFSLNWPQRNGQFWLKTVFLRFCIGAMTKTTTMSKTKTKTTTTKTMKMTTANRERLFIASSGSFQNDRNITLEQHRLCY